MLHTDSPQIPRHPGDHLYLALRNNQGYRYHHDVHPGGPTALVIHFAQPTSSVGMPEGGMLF